MVTASRPPADGDPVPLTAEDRAILELEGPTIAGHTCKVVILDGPAPDVAALRSAIGERIGDAPMLMHRLGGSDDAPAWVLDEGFDVDRHVVPAPVAGPIARAELRPVVASLFEQRLDRSLPLWQIDSIALEGGGAALVWRLHHALADGTAAMRYSRALLWDPEPASKPGAHGSPAHPASDHHRDDDARRRGHLAAFIGREFARSRHGSPFDGEIGTRRRIAFANAPLAELHDAAKALAGATLNDAVLATVAGSLRRWIEHHHGDLGNVRAKVPVSLHHESDDAGNRDSFFSLPLPLNEPDAVERLRAVQLATVARKYAEDAETLDQMLSELGGISPRLERLAERIERSPRAFALNVSNVPGPRTPVQVLGAPVAELHTIAEIGERHALRIAVVSMAGTLCFGLCADPAIVDDLEGMAAGIEAETAALIAAGT